MAVHFPFLRGTGQRRFDDTMPSDPFTREKFTKERSARQEAIREYFKRDPNERFQTELASWRVSERMCKQVSVSLPLRGDSHDDQRDDYTGTAGSTAC